MKHDLVDNFWLMMLSDNFGGGQKLFAEGTIPAAFKVTESIVGFDWRYSHELRACRRSSNRNNRAIQLGLAVELRSSERLRVPLRGLNTT